MSLRGAALAAARDAELRRQQEDAEKARRAQAKWDAAIEERWERMYDFIEQTFPDVVVRQHRLWIAPGAFTPPRRSTPDPWTSRWLVHVDDGLWLAHHLGHRGPQSSVPEHWRVVDFCPGCGYPAMRPQLVRDLEGLGGAINAGPDYDYKIHVGKCAKAREVRDAEAG